MPRSSTGPKLKWIKSRQTYYVVWYEGGKTRKRSTGTDDPQEAQAYYLEFCNYAASTKGNATPEMLPVVDALVYYAEHKAVHATEPARIAYALDALIPYWKDYTVAEITQQTCNGYFACRNNSREKGIAPSTVRRELGVIVAALNFCFRERKLTQVVNVPLPQKPPPKDRWLTRSEMAKLLWQSRKGVPEARGYLPLYMLIGIYTGARPEAILSLTWDRVDLEKRRMDFQIPGRRITKKRRPQVPIPDRLMTFLRFAHESRTADDGPVVHRRGKPITRIIRGFKAAAKRASLDGVTPHVLRHTRATWMAQDGVSMWQIAGFLGQDEQTTSKIYSHHSPDFLEDAIRSIDRRKHRTI